MACTGCWRESRGREAEAGGARAEEQMLLDEGRRRRSGAVVLYSPASSSEAEGIHGRMGLHWLVGDAKRGGGRVGRVDWMDWIGDPEEGETRWS